MINYAKASDVEQLARRIIDVLKLNYIDPERMAFYRSTGSRARRVQARIHGLGRIWFDALNIRPRYIIEVISEEFDILEPHEKEKVIIHELMHIPSGFSGGFVPHRGRISKRSVEAMHKTYSEASRKISSTQNAEKVFLSLIGGVSSNG